MHWNRLPRRAAFLGAPVIAGALLVVASRAISPTGPEGAGATRLALGASLENHLLVPGLAGDDAAGSASTPAASPTPTKTPAPTATPQSIPGGSQLTMQPGTGLIFAPFAIGPGDRDIWWNGIEFVPGTPVEMQSLGVFTSAGDLPAEPPVAGYGGLPVDEPSPGELYALRFPDREHEGYTAYAFIWVSTGYRPHFESHPVTFSYRYFPGEACGGAQAQVTALKKQHPDENVVVTGEGDLTGWWLESEFNAGPGVQRFDFPDGFVLDGSVTIHSAAAQADVPPGDLWWTHLPMWDGGHSDDALLYNCEGVLVSRFDDGE